MTRLTIEERVQLHDDEREILRTMYQYGHTLDYGAEDGFLDCFTPTGVWEVAAVTTSKPFTARRYTGRDELIAFFRQHTHAPALYHKHLLIEPRIQIQGDTAGVESYWLRIEEHSDGPYIKSFGRYKDELVRCTDGRWRFSVRTIEPESSFVRPGPTRA